MALNRAPTAIQVNGAALLVKGDSAGLFSKYQRVPGLSNFTLPDETGSTNEVQLMDGSVAFAQIAGVGSITGSIGAISGHPVHTWLAGKRRNGDAITVSILRPAGATRETEITDSKIEMKAPSGGKAVVEVTGQNDSIKAKNVVREGLLVALHALVGVADSDFYSVLRTNAAVDENSTDRTMDKFRFEVEGGATIAAAASLSLLIRSPGLVYRDIQCTVAGLGDGDFQAGGALAANITLQPAEALPQFTVYKKDLASIGTDFDSAFADVA